MVASQHRHFIHHTKGCFYNKDTWQGVDAETFRSQARHCAQESLHSLYEDDDGELCMSCHCTSRRSELVYITSLMSMYINLLIIFLFVFLFIFCSRRWK